MTFYFITHPNVVVSRDVPVPRWPLSELGRQRMRAGLKQPWVKDIRAIYCSTEQKAIDGARILAEHLGLGFTQIEELGENDRSATGFLPPTSSSASQMNSSRNHNAPFAGGNAPSTRNRASLERFDRFLRATARSPSSPMARSAPCSTVTSPASRSLAAGTSRRTAGAISSLLPCRHRGRTHGGARSINQRVLKARQSRESEFQGVVVVTDVSVAGWTLTAFDEAARARVVLALCGITVLSFVALLIHRRIMSYIELIRRI